MIVSKLKGARDRKRRDTGMKVEGRTRYAESRPEVVTMAKKLHRDALNGRRRSLGSNARWRSGRPFPELTAERKNWQRRGKGLPAKPGAVLAHEPAPFEIRTAEELSGEGGARSAFRRRWMDM
jgi:hypothetical protein